MWTESGQFRNCGHFFTHRVWLSSSPSQPSRNVLHNLAALYRIRHIPGLRCGACDASSKLMRWDNAHVALNINVASWRASAKRINPDDLFVRAVQMVLEHDKCVSRRVCLCVRVVIEIYNYRKCISNSPPPPSHCT